MRHFLSNPVPSALARLLSAAPVIGAVVYALVRLAELVPSV